MRSWTMHPVAAGIWSAFLAGVVVAEWADPEMAHTALWIGLVVYFAVFETWGGIRRWRGDMLSEAMWTFSSGKWGARAFTAAFGVYFAERLYMLGAPASFPALAPWMPRATLVAGFAVWISVHLYTEGRAA